MERQVTYLEKDRNLPAILSANLTQILGFLAMAHPLKKGGSNSLKQTKKYNYGKNYRH
jgi:hypothetical protein